MSSAPPPEEGKPLAPPRKDAAAVAGTPLLAEEPSASASPERPPAPPVTGRPSVVLPNGEEAELVARFSGRWWWDHSGRIAGMLLGLFVLAVLVLLALAGDGAATGLLALVAAGAVMIIVGGRMRR
jgi:hypothetical protein